MMRRTFPYHPLLSSARLVLLFSVLAAVVRASPRLQMATKLGTPCTQTCPAGLVCESGTCKLAENSACSPGDDGCVVRTACVGPTGRQRCQKPAQVGERCGSGTHPDCDLRLACERGVCKRGQGGDCNADASFCASGTMCIGPDNKKECRQPMDVGKRCGNDPYWVCAPNLLCEEGVCKRNQGDDCDDHPSNCASGTACVGPPGYKQCRIPMDAGKRCGGDPYWVCGASLLCEDYVCKRGHGGDCSDNASICASGTKCVGNDTKKQCKRPMKEGERCGVDPFWVCQDGLQCVGNKCTSRKNNNSCDDNGSECASGMHCVGPNGKKKCRRLMQSGERCGVDPYWVCEKGLTCEDQKCKRESKTDCSDDASVCTSGTKCVGPDGRKKCRKPKQEGGQCRVDPYWVCDKGLTCINQTCQHKGQKECNSDASACPPGLQCVGPQGKKLCRKAMQLDERCGTDPYWVCDKKLTCSRNKCKLDDGGDCTSKAFACRSGTRCVGPSGRKRCRKPMQIGDKCGVDPYWVCTRQLVCEDNKCKRAMGGKCNTNSSACASGTVCAGPKGRKQCRKPMKVGAKCKGDPYWVCEPGATCEDGMCRIADGGDCAGKRTNMCRTGRACMRAQAKNKKICMVTAGKNATCNANRPCQRPLVCADGRCKDRKRLPLGAACGTPKTSCRAGLRCVKRGGEKSCRRVVEKGSTCGKSTPNVCKAGLSCKNETCE